MDGSTFQLVTADARMSVRKPIAWSCLAILLLGIGMLASATRADAATVWTPRTMAVPVGGSEIKGAGVSCPQVPQYNYFCMGVGSYKTATTRKSLAERWDGKKWEVLPLPFAETEEESSLNGVSCPTTTYCMAVGQMKLAGKVRALNWQWNGTIWQFKPVPLPAETEESVLNGVSCFSTTNCVAVGYFKKVGGAKAPLTEAWNGTAWVQTVPPSPEKTEESVLNGVACPSATACEAVGFYKTGSVVKALAERYASAKWELHLPPHPEKALESRLEGVSCGATPAACMAVGSFVNASSVKMPLAERWLEPKWETPTVPVPAGATAGSLSSVYCIVPALCMASGAYTLSGTGRPLAVRWSAPTWTLELPTAPGGIFGTETNMAGISCEGWIRCMTVGYYKTSAVNWAPMSQTGLQPSLPKNLTLPTVSPTAPQTGVLETATTGTWAEEPTSYAYQWRRCNASGLECVDILGATNSTYTPVAADVGKTLVVKVTATNAVGSDWAISKATEIVT